jgi:hypothetical protein
MNDSGDQINIAREAILVDLKERFHKRDPGVRAASDIRKFLSQTNYFSGGGVMTCPICKTGQLQYNRSGYNMHVYARCSTEGCVAWME